MMNSAGLCILNLALRQISITDFAVVLNLIR